MGDVPREWDGLVPSLLFRAVFVIRADPLSFLGVRGGNPQGSTLPQFSKNKKYLQNHITQSFMRSK